MNANDILLKAKGFVQKNGARILTVLSVGGTLATVAVTLNAGPKINDILAEDIPKKPKRKKLVKAALPIVAVAGGTIGCTIGANIVNEKQKAALTAALSMANLAYNRYKGKIEELFGEDEAKIVDMELAKELPHDEETEDDEELFYIDWSGMPIGHHVTTTLAKIKEAEYEINRIQAVSGYVTYRTAYNLFGITPYTIEEDASLDIPIEPDDTSGWITFVDDFYMTDSGDDGKEWKYRIVTRPPWEV